MNQMSELPYIDETFLKDFRDNKVGEPYLYISVLDKPLVCQRKENLEDIFINEAFHYIHIMDSNNNLQVIKNKFCTEDSIMLLMRTNNRSPKEVVSSIDSIISKALKDLLSIDTDNLYINDIGEVYLNNKKIVSFDVKEVSENNKKSIYVLLLVYCKNTQTYGDILRYMSVKSTYGYIDDYYELNDIDSLCQYIKSLLINEFLIKDFSKAYTLSYIKNLLKENGIESTEETTSLVDNIFISKVTLPELGMQQLGKGVTYDASICSGYAETLERLQNLQFFPESMDLFYNISDFKTYADERIAGNRIYLPFYKVNSNSIEYLDIENIWDSQKSNGMASGNTYYEAIVQGLCEIFERFVEREIYTNNYTPPDVSREYLRSNYTFQYRIITELENKLNVKILVKDCSLFNAFPVVALIIIDNKDKTYKKVFGSHPLFEEALNRCLSELLQKDSLSFEEIKTLNFTNIYLSEYYNKPYFRVMRTCGHLGKISIPNSFFFKKSSWEFLPWKEDNIYSNKVWAKYLIDIIYKNNWDLYIRSNDFLGFPCVYMYIPRVSEISTNEYSYIQKQVDLLVHEQKQLKSEDIPKVLEFIENYEDNTYLTNLDRDWLLIYLYFISDNYQKLIDMIRVKSNSSDNLKCLAMEIYLKSNGVSEEDRDNILNTFFGLDYVGYIKRFWRHKEDSISIFRSDYFTRANTLINKDRFKDLKELMLRNSKDQSTFNSIFVELSNF